MKKATFILILAILLLAVFSPFSLGAKTASAQAAGYTIQNVDHQIEVMYSGNVVIRDTITVSGQITDGFQIGFPYKYGAYLLKSEAFDAKQVYPLNLGVRLGNLSGFYGAEVTFPANSPQVFTVVFILANSLLTKIPDGLSLDFPAYPSLAQAASRCNVTLALPVSTLFNVTKADGLISTKTFVKDNLEALANYPATADFNIAPGVIQQIAITSLDRVVTLGPAGDVAISDSYRIVNNSTGDLGSVKLDVPANASSITGRDEFGRSLTVQTLSDSGNPNTVSVNVTLLSSLRSSQSVTVAINYGFPSVVPDQTHFALNLELFPYFNYYAYSASVSIVPPEGAHIVLPELSTADPNLSLDRQLFQETLRINRDGVSYVDRDVPSGNAVQVAYDYNPLWLSLRPTLWVWALAAVGIVVGAFWRRPRKPSAPAKIEVPKLAASFSPDHVRAFLDTYEERTRVSSELKALVARAQKGKIPRRQYKVQRRALELRFDALSKNIAELKATFRNAGGNYANLVRQLDASESELSKVEANIRNAEARNRTGELPLEEYKQTLVDLQRRKEKAESTVNGTLLRLREEIR